MNNEMMKTGGYIDGFKEAKRLISEGRAQLNSAKDLEFAAIDAEFLGMYKTADKKQEFAGEKESVAIEKITRGLEIYRGLLRYENLQHFPRVKTVIEGTINEFEAYLPSAVQERCYGALFVGPE